MNAVAERFSVSAYTGRKWLREGRLMGVQMSDSPKATGRVSEDAIRAFRDGLRTNNVKTTGA